MTVSKGIVSEPRIRHNDFIRV